ncbi:MAG TPA: glycoside hydrolase family 11 protein [Ohtaekwangia sp.]
MKTHLHRLWRIPTLLFITLFLSSFASVTAQTICSNQTGTHGGYYYSWWSDGAGSACITMGANGNYSTSWSNVNNFVGGKGWSTGTANRVVNFSGSFNGGSNGYLCLYGWTRNSLVEYYVVENYGAWTPPGAQSAGTFNSDGGTYNLYRTLRQNAPCIDGNNCTFYQYWSVRTSKRSSGTITFANHVAAWASKGWNLGSSWAYQIMATEGYQSSGNSNITISTGTPPPNPPPGGGNNTIVVRARGTNGSESIQLQVNNSTIQTWTLGTSMQNYTATTSATGGINVRFTNDASNRDVQVDYIQVNGSTRQAESQTTNTGVYQNGQCGGSNSEWMHCNGYIGFGNVTASGRLPADDLIVEKKEIPDFLSDQDVSFENPVRNGVLNMKVTPEVTEVRIIDFSGRTMKVIPVTSDVLTEELSLTRGLYILQTVKSGQKLKPERLVIE